MSRFHSGLYRCCISPVQWGEYHYHCVRQSTKGSCELAAPSKKGDPTKRGLIFIFKPNIMIEWRTRVFLPFGSFGLSVQARPHIVITLLITQTSSSLQVYIFRYRLPTTHNVVCSPIIVCFCDNLYSHNKVKSAFISSRLQPFFGAMAFSGKSGKTMVFSVEQFKRVVLGDVCLLTGIQMEGICIDLENCAVDTRRTCGRGQRPCMPAAAWRIGVLYHCN